MLVGGFVAPLIAVVWFGVMPPRSFALAAEPSLANS